MRITLDQVRSFLIESFALDPAELEDDVPLFTSGLLDSLSALEIIVFVENHIKTAIDRTELSLDDLDTVEDIVRMANKVDPLRS